MRNYLVPENLDLSQFTYPEKTARFLHMLIRRRYLSNLRSARKFGKTKDYLFYGDRRVSIPSLTLKRSISDDYLRIYEELHEQGVVGRTYFDREAHKAYDYYFMDGYSDVPLKSVSFRPNNYRWFDGWLRKKKERDEEKIKQSEMLKAGHRLALEHLHSISMEYDQEDISRVLRTIQSEENRKYRQEQRRKASGKQPRKKELREQAIRAVHRCNHVLYKCNEIITGAEERYVPFYSIDKYGRFHYFLTNLPKTLRPFVRLNNNRVTGYDITSSQCIFFALAVRKEANDTIPFRHILDEIRRYWPSFMPDVESFLQKEAADNRRERCEDIPYMTLRRYRASRIQGEIDLLFKLLSGDFYKFLMIEAGAKWKTEKEFKRKRNSFKGDFFEFLYGPNRKCGKIFCAFQRALPYITLLLWKMKDLGRMHRRTRELREEGMMARAAWKQVKSEAQKEKRWYVRLPLRMQETEANFMFNKVAPKIGRAFLPVHDCILVEKTGRRNIKNIATLLRSEFKKEGVEVNITSEDW